MHNYWIDIFNGPHVHFFQKVDKFIKNIIFTARDYKPIPDLVKLYGINAKIIGRHGGRGKHGKLKASTNRILDLAKYIGKQQVSYLLHKHSVEAARVAWGFGIPSISFIDNELMVPQNMLVCPLSNVLIAPLPIEQFILRNFTPSHVSILQFDGICEIANVYDLKPDENVLNKLGLITIKPIIVIRGEPILAAYNSNVSIVAQLIDRIKRDIPDAQIILIKREGDKIINKNLPAFDARSLCCFADIVISGGGTLTREAALLGAKAISFFNGSLAVDRYLVNKKLLQQHPGKNILKINWKKEIKRKLPKINLNNFEHPFSLLYKAERLIELKNGKK